jgi:hypothetical protein
MLTTQLSKRWKINYLKQEKEKLDCPLLLEVGNFMHYILTSNALAEPLAKAQSFIEKPFSARQKHTTTTYFVPHPELLVPARPVLGRSKSFLSELGRNVLHRLVGPRVAWILAFEVFTHFKVAFLPKRAQVARYLGRPATRRK